MCVKHLEQCLAHFEPHTTAVLIASAVVTIEVYSRVSVAGECWEG
jgi:hypothetical protein